ARSRFLVQALLFLSELGIERHAHPAGQARGQPAHPASLDPRVAAWHAVGLDRGAWSGAARTDGDGGAHQHAEQLRSESRQRHDRPRPRESVGAYRDHAGRVAGILVLAAGSVAGAGSRPSMRDEPWIPAQNVKASSTLWSTDARSGFNRMV